MSSRDAAIAYLHERFALRRYVPLAVLLAAAGMLASGTSPGWTEMAAVTVAVLMGILSLRIVDDLADRERDALRVPRRITVRAASPAPFIALAAVAGVAAVLLFAAGGDAPERLVALLVAATVLASWYATRHRMGASPLVNAHVVLLKYPLLVVAAAGSPRTPAAVPCAAGLLYVALLIHEMHDDPELRGRARAVLLAHWIALLVLGALLHRAATLSPTGST